MKNFKILFMLAIMFAVGSAFRSANSADDRKIYGWTGSVWVLVDDNDLCIGDLLQFVEHND